MPKFSGQAELIGVLALVAVIGLALIAVSSNYQASTEGPAGEFKLPVGKEPVKEPACIPSAEICDGKDNDCDGEVDEGNLCPEGYNCLNGKCEFTRIPLSESYFPQLPKTFEEGYLLYRDITEIPEPKFHGYIIQFQEKPLIKYKKQLEEQGYPEKTISQRMNSYRTNLLKIHETIKSKIKQLIPDSEFIGEFKNVFNGLAVDVSEEEIWVIEQLPEVKEVFKNYEVQLFLNESVPLINADDVWLLQDEFGRNITGQNITIAIIDTGVDYTHPDLGGCTTEQFLNGECEKVIGGYDFSDNDTDPMDYHGHGTHVAGIAASTGDGSGGVLKGVAPDAKLYAYKVFPNSRDSTVAAAIERAVDPNDDGNFSDHVDIISMSIGISHFNYGNCYQIVSSIASDNAVDAGVVVVISAGNNDAADYFTIGAPGCAKKAITVGASDKQDDIAYFSSRGPTKEFGLKPDILAPGVDITSARLGGGYISKSGTSMAAPHVSGAAALIKQAHSDWTPQEIKHALRNTATDLGYDILTQGYGRIDVLETVQSERQPIAILNTSGIIREDVIINITGTATADDNISEFRYILEYARGYSPNENDWVLLTESSERVIDGVLYRDFNLSDLSGLNSLRLKSIAENEVISEDISFILLSGSTCSSCFECQMLVSSFRNSVLITNDLISSGTCINFLFHSTNVTIDCNGHSIIKDSTYYNPSTILPSYPPAGIRSWHYSITNMTTIKNCVIMSLENNSQFVEGLGLYFIFNSNLINNTVYNNPIGINSYFGDNNTMINNTMYGNTINLRLLYQNNAFVDTSNTVNNKPVYYFQNV